MHKENKIFSTLLLGLLLITIFSILGYQFAGQPEEDDTPVDFIRVMTYNVHLYYDYGAQGQYNLIKLRDLIEKHDPDIIGLQESDGNRVVSSNQNAVMWLAQQLKMYYYYGAPTSDGVWGVSLLSRWEIKDPKVISLPSEDALSRIAVVAKIDVPGSIGRLDVVVTHLDYQDVDTQAAQVDKIIEITKGMSRAIILGDFNTVLAQDEYGLTLAEDPTYIKLNNSFIDAWVVSGGSFDETTSFYFEETVTYDVSNARIDFIWLTETLSPVINSHKVLGDKDISDHRAVMIDIELQS